MIVKKIHNIVQKTSFWRFIRHNILEIHLAEHCNLNCTGCSHYSPIAEPAFCDLKVLDRNLCKLSKYEKSFHLIHLLGGEPLLNPDISIAFEIVRRHFKNTKIDLITNGILLINGKLPNLFWEACRKFDINIYVTLYPIRKINYEEIRQTCKKKGVKVNIGGDRTQDGSFTLFNLSPKGDGNKLVYRRCTEGRCWQLVGNKIYPCPQSAYVGHLNKKFDSNFLHRKGDYLEIDKINCRNLLLFKFRPKPFCAYCVFPRQNMRWKLSSHSAAEWIKQE